MDECELKPSKPYPCIFIGEKFIVISCVDYFLLYSPKYECIYKVIKELKIQGVYFNREGDANGFLGVEIISCNKKNEVTLTQTGLTDQNFKTLGLQEAKCDSTHTPSYYGKFTQD